MPVTVFDPQKIEAAKEFFLKKGEEDGNLSSIVVGDSKNMGVGVGTWDPGQKTLTPVPVAFDEVLFIVEGTFRIETDGERHEVSAGQVAHLAAGSLVNFGSETGCRLVWVTSPPTWVALEALFKSGAIPGAPPK